VFSNDDLLSSRIRNFGRMRERRVSFNLGVTYQTTVEKLAKVPGIIKAAIESQKLTRFDRSHFNKYGDFALNFETVFYVGTPDFNQWMDIQQAINFSIKENFEKEGIEFAYPTQTVFMVPDKEGGERTPKPLGN
jgi:small-conductance mechanosensitive channel